MAMGPLRMIILGMERVSEFNREARLANLLRVRRSEADELRPHIVDNVEVAVRPVIVAQTEIGTHSLRVRRVQLQRAAERQEP